MADVQVGGRRHPEKWKAEQAHKRTFLQKECVRRASGNHVKADKALNSSVGCLSTLVTDTAEGTRALTRGVLDRESKETQKLEDALEIGQSGDYRP